MEPTLRRRLRSWATDRFLDASTACFSRLPWSAAQRLGRALGALAWHVVRRDRRRAVEHVGIAFPELDPRERRALARRSFLHLGVTLGENLHLARRDCSDVLAHVEIAGLERFRELSSTGRPVVFATAHCGNWELSGAAFVCSGLELTSIARRLNDPALQERIVGMRRRFGIETIVRESPGAARRLLEVFRRGSNLVILIDQDTRVEGVFVPFFGRPAYTPVGAARIAARRGAVVVPGFIERRADGSHLLTLHPALEDLPDDVTAATARITEAIEAQIRRRPEQWVWLHRRWRRQPGDGNDGQ